MKDDLDFAEIDKAINESMANQSPASRPTAKKPTPKPAPKAAALKPAAKPTAKMQDVRKPVSTPARVQPRGRFIDIIPPKKPLPTVRVETTEITTYYERTVPASAPKPAERQAPVYPPHQPQTANIETVLTEELFAEETIDSLSPAEERAAADFARVPEPLDSVPMTEPYRPPTKFVNNLKVEKRPLSGDVPEDHDSNITSTHNTYSRRSIMEEPIRDKKDKKSKKDKKEKRIKVKDQKPAKEDKGGLGIGFFLVLMLIIALGAGVGFLLYLLLAN